MYPHERSLVNKMEGRAFALIGVNSDRSKAEVKQAMAKEQITWRSFWNGGSTNGPISNAWRVRGWPTIYVLDANGVIRARDIREKAMDRVVDELLAELDGKK